MPSKYLDDDDFDQMDGLDGERPMMDEEWDNMERAAEAVAIRKQVAASGVRGKWARESAAIDLEIEKFIGDIRKESEERREELQLFLEKIRRERE